MNRIVPLILAVALFMEQMDSTVISTALPAIAADLGVGPITLKLALTAYMVALAIFIPISGWMADRFGAKRVFRLAIIVFMVGSVLCAISSSLVGFVLARFLQGMGGAMMTPVGRLVLLRTTKRSELVNAMALLTIPALVGPLAGPPLGGFITTFFTWHWIFLINIPVGVAGLWLTGIYLPEVPATSPPPLDIGGLIQNHLEMRDIERRFHRHIPAVNTRGKAQDRSAMRHVGEAEAAVAVGFDRRAAREMGFPDDDAAAGHHLAGN